MRLGARASWGPMGFLRTTGPRFAVLALGVLLASCGGKEGSGRSRSTEAATSAEPKRHGLTEAEAKQVLAKVGEHTITLGDFAERLAEQSPYLRARYNSPERRRELLEQMVRFELLALEAERQGFTEDPQVARAVEQVMVEQMMKDLFTDRIRAEDISEDEVKAYYEAHRDEFHRPAQVRIAHILVRSEAEARKLLEELQAAAPKMEAFRRLAAARSLDQRSRRRGGDLGYHARPGDQAAEEAAERVPRAVIEAAFRLEKVGELVPQPVRSERGWHVVMLTGRRSALHRTLEEVRRTIVNRLWRQKRDEAIAEFVEDLKRKAKVRIDEAALAQVRVDGQPVGAPKDGAAESGADGRGDGAGSAGQVPQGGSAPAGQRAGAADGGARP